MTLETIAVLGLLAATLAAFLSERWPSDQVSIVLFAAVLGLSLLDGGGKFPKSTELLNLLGNPAPVTIAMMFVISAALDRTGLIAWVAQVTEPLSRLGDGWFLLTMMVGAGAVSAIINNTPVVVVFVPVALNLARKMKQPASRYLIPLAYAATMGGCCTLIGTSTNILSSSLLARHGQAPFGFWELGTIGLPLGICGSLLVAWWGGRLLPAREPVSSILTEEERREYLTEMVVPRGSKASGKTPRQAGLRRARGVHLLEILRDGQPIATSEMNETALADGDRLLLSCRPSGFAHARSLDGLLLSIEEELGVDTVAAHEGTIMEGVIGPKSRLIGRTLREANFHQSYRLVPLAIHRRGVNMQRTVRRITLEFGDTLLLMGPDEARERLRQSGDVLLLDHPPTPSISQRQKAPLVLAILLIMVVAASLEIVPIAAASILAVAGLFLTGCMKPREAYEAIEWSVIALIIGTMSLGLAMESTGTAAWLAEGLVRAVSGAAPSDWQPLAALGAVYLLTLVFTEILSNNATVVLMTPLAIGLATGMGLDARPFAVAVCIASSAGFASPIGYQTYSYVYGVGGYRFTDFLRLGLPLDLFYFAGAMVLIPKIWPL